MRQQLTVVQLVPSLNIGGVERGTIELAIYLKSLGHRSIVISEGGVWQQRLDRANVEHIRLGVGRKSLFSLKHIWTLRKLFAELKADIVHARSRLPAWLTYLAIKKMPKKPQFVTTIHGLYSVKKYSSIMSRGDAVIAVSETASSYVQAHFQDYLKTQPQVIYRGVDRSEFPHAYQPSSEWLQQWFADYPQIQGKKIVLMPGRLTALKGAESLIHWLSQADENVHLVLTAQPNQSAYTQRISQLLDDGKLQNKVSWVGLSHPIQSLYALADVVVSVNKKPESFGRTVMEALCIGTPVVAYTLGGVEEIMRVILPQGLVEADDQQQLAEKIDEFLQRPPEVNPKDYFQQHDMLQQTVDLYQKLAQST
ncbi:glycosyltransferase [Marinicella sp. W31]|uniref:glycosyltransferase n=1 Tax=Marinicella sp. W31 TaxID=3023713 RepID=UPI003757C7E6